MVVVSVVTTILKLVPNHPYPHPGSPDTFERLKQVIQTTLEESIQTTAAHAQPRPQVLTPQD